MLWNVTVTRVVLSTPSYYKNNKEETMDPLQKFAHAFRAHANEVCSKLEEVAADTNNPNRVDAMQAALAQFCVHLNGD